MWNRKSRGRMFRGRRSVGRCHSCFIGKYHRIRRPSARTGTAAVHRMSQGHADGPAMKF